MKFDDLHKQPEGQNLEFKTSFGRETVETVTAFSNASGGTIIEKFGTGFFRIQSELQNSPELRFIVESLNGVMCSGMDVTHQDTHQDTAQVRDLIMTVDGEMNRDEIQKKLKLTHRENFRKFYLKPALESGLIEMTIPGKPNSRHQKYRLTEKGKQMKNKA
jgi:predicted HTH transcriptional regulator